jgi:DNA-binding transcriptional LysR family regulator
MMNHLGLMETFVVVVQAGSFSQASRRLGVSRAIVSRHILQLEDHIGARLFNRTTRAISSTEAGQKYFSFCTRVLEEIKGAEDDLRNDQKEIKGTLRVSVPASFGTFYIAPAVHAFTAKYPGIHVSLILCDPAPQATDLFENGFNIAIRLSDIQASSVICRRIGKAPWALCATNKYLAANPPIEHPRDLKKHNCLNLVQYAPDNIWRFVGSREETIKISGTLSSNNATILKSAVLQGDGVSILPLYACHDELRQGFLKPLLRGYAVSPERPINIFYANRRFLPDKLKLFVEFISKWLKERDAEISSV